MKISVVGSFNMDYSFSVGHIPATGETILATGFSKALGGKGFNQAVAAARAGAEVNMFGAVGQDADGERILAQMAEEHMPTRFVLKKESGTGKAFIAVDPAGKNTIIVDSGANFDLSSQDVARWKEAIAEADLCLMQLELPMPVVQEVLHFCHARGITTVLNAAPVPEQVPLGMLGDVDVLVVNENELLQLSGKSDPEAAMQALFDAGAQTLIYTIGEQGSEYLTRPSGRVETVHLPAYSVPAIDTTGAGDTYLGALVAEWNPENLPASMQFATASSALAVQKRGAVASIPKREQILEWMKRHPV